MHSLCKTQRDRRVREPQKVNERHTERRPTSWLWLICVTKQLDGNTRDPQLDWSAELVYCTTTEQTLTTDHCVIIPTKIKECNSIHASSEKQHIRHLIFDGSVRSVKLTKPLVPDRPSRRVWFLHWWFLDTSAQCAAFLCLPISRTTKEHLQ